MPKYASPAWLVALLWSVRRLGVGDLQSPLAGGCLVRLHCFLSPLLPASLPWVYLLDLPVGPGCIEVACFLLVSLAFAPVSVGYLGFASLRCFVFCSVLLAPLARGFPSWACSLVPRGSALEQSTEVYSRLTRPSLSLGCMDPFVVLELGSSSLA